MKLKIFLLIIFLNVFVNCYSQNSLHTEKQYPISDLRSQFSKSVANDILEINSSSAASTKSPILAILFSLVLPGAGHYYLNRMDVGKYFLGIDAASWIGLASLNIYGNSVRDDSRAFSVDHADVTDIDNKDDDYFSNVGNYNDVYEYNNDKLTRGEYAKLYDPGKFFWNWDNADNRNIFETQRKNSERIYNSRVIFGSMLVVNRIISGISAYLIANKSVKNTSLNIMPEVMYKNNYAFDGVKINFSKNFNF